MLMTTLILGAIFWMTVTAIIVNAAQDTGGDEKDNYCRLECKDYSQLQPRWGHKGSRHGSAGPAGQEYFMIFGGHAHD